MLIIMKSISVSNGLVLNETAGADEQLSCSYFIAIGLLGIGILALGFLALIL